MKGKTENMKSIVDIEEKVRQDMSKVQKRIPSASSTSRGIFFGGPKMGKQ